MYVCMYFSLFPSLSLSLSLPPPPHPVWLSVCLSVSFSFSLSLSLSLSLSFYLSIPIPPLSLHPPSSCHRSPLNLNSSGPFYSDELSRVPVARDPVLSGLPTAVNVVGNLETCPGVRHCCAAHISEYLDRYSCMHKRETRTRVQVGQQERATHRDDRAA